MEKGFIYLLLLLICTEVAFIIFAIKAIKTTLKYNDKKNTENQKLKITTLLFLVFAIISEVSYGFFSYHILGKLIYITFLLFELYYINFLQKNYINNKTANLIFSTLLLILAPFFISLLFLKRDITLLNITLALESFLVGCICLKFFFNLKNNITNNRLLNEQGTLLMIGLFFCYSIPLPFNSTIAVLSIFDQNISNRESRHFLTYFTLSRLGTICYIFLFYFIRKAFK